MRTHLTPDELGIFENAPEATRNEIYLGALSIQILTHLLNRTEGYTVSEIATSISADQSPLSNSVCASRVRSLRDGRFVSQVRHGGRLVVAINEAGKELREVLLKKIRELIYE
jgi:hypothetical protein